MTKGTGRCAILLVAALALPPLIAQVDRSTLTAKYGQPVEEVLDIRPDVRLALLYGDNGQVCKIEIRPARNVSSVIPAALVQELVDEGFPPSIRGTPKRQFGAGTGAESFWKWAEYEGWTVSQTASDRKPNPQAEVQNALAVIQFKSCQERRDFLVTNTICRSALLSQDGRKSQGACDVPIEEVFRMRPGITLAAFYGNDQQACRLDILLPRSASLGPVSLIGQLVDEVVPPFVRGTVKLKLFNCDGACWMTTDSEKVHIEQDRGNPMSDQGGGTVSLSPEAAQTVLARIQIKSCEVPR